MLAKALLKHQDQQPRENYREAHPRGQQGLLINQQLPLQHV